VKNILVFELNWLGDIIFSLPFLRALRKNFPEARIVCAVVPRYAGLLVNDPWIDGIIHLSDNNRITGLPERISFVRRIRAESYDTAFFLKPSRTKTAMAVSAGIRERIGFPGKGASITREVEAPGMGVHRVDHILALATAFGVHDADRRYEYFVTDADIGCMEALLVAAGGGKRRVVALNPGGNWDAKRWPPERFGQLALKLIERFEDIEVVVTGAPKDRVIAAGIARRASSDRCYSVAGKTGLNELAALFKKSALVVSADSGPLHLAAASGSLTIALFGPTSEAVTGPRGKEESVVIKGEAACEIPCYADVCKKDFICMKSIRTDEVFREAERMLA
jgi:lipopolysaccharide heptosyltransferase II